MAGDLPTVIVKSVWVSKWYTSPPTPTGSYFISFSSLRVSVVWMVPKEMLVPLVLR